MASKTKGQALDDFTARLLSSPMKDYIARIVLFGSVLDGEDRLSILHSSPVVIGRDTRLSGTWASTIETM